MHGLVKNPRFVAGKMSQMDMQTDGRTDDMLWHNDAMLRRASHSNNTYSKVSHPYKSTFA